MFLASSSQHSGPEGIVIVVGILAISLIVILAQRQRRQKAFRGAAAALGATVRSMTGDELTASARGFVFTFHLDPGGKNSPPHTYIHVKTPPFDLLLDLVKEGDKRRNRAAGYVDIEIGDAAFDAAWIVEGAPAGRVKRLLADDALRRRLLACSDQPEAEVQIEDGDVHFSKRGSDYKSGIVITANLELMLDLATAVMTENALAAPDAPVTEGDYRSAPAADRDRSGEREQIVLLKRKRALRRVESTRIGLLLFPVAVVGITIAFFAFASKTPPGSHIFLLVELAMIGVFFRGAGSNYFAARRTAGLPPDYALFAVLGAVVIAVAATSLGVFGF